MNDWINAVIALAMLAALVVQLAEHRPDHGRPVGCNTRALARALIGAYLLSVAFLPLTGQHSPAAQTALLVGLALLLLVRWRRRPENTR